MSESQFNLNSGVQEWNNINITVCISVSFVQNKFGGI